MSISPNLNILSPEDVLAAIHHTKTTVTVRGITFSVRAPTITEICELIGRFPDLLELLDPRKRDDASGENDAILHLFRRAPHAAAAFSACAMDRPGNIEFENDLMTKPDDFRIDLFAAAAEALFREHGTLSDFFHRLLQRLQDLGLTRVSTLISQILVSTSSSPDQTATTTSQSKPMSRKRIAGRKAV